MSKADNRGIATVMLEKQLGHRWKHGAARAIGHKVNTALEENLDYGEVQVERKEIETEVGSTA